LRGYCKRILKLVDEHLLPNVKSIEAKVFYLKMRGDYNRYLCEFGDNNQCVESARSSYEEADNLARNNLASTNPIRLGLHLNISVYYYEILNKHERAIELANRAFEDAIANIDNVNEENYKDCTTIMQLLRDNITLWSSEHQDDSYQ
jgi:14-3-3 protein epsilon